MPKRARLCCELCGVSGINSGEMDGQTVFHCHLHLIPRREGDTEDPTGGVRNAFAGKGAYRGVLRPDRGRLPQRHRRRSAVTSAEIARGFVEKGWQIRYRGGNSVCSTPSDLDLVVADAPRDPPRYSIAAWPSGAGPSGRRGLVLDLYDADRGVAARVRAAFPRPSGRRSCSPGTACRPTRQAALPSKKRRWYRKGRRRRSVSGRARVRRSDHERAVDRGGCAVDVGEPYSPEGHGGSRVFPRCSFVGMCAADAS